MPVEQLFLKLADLDDRHPGVTPAKAATFYEAARVCLDRHHESPLDFTLEDNGDVQNANASWDKSDERCRAAHANETDATTWGAYCFALASTEIMREMVAIGRAENGTGADYYLNKSGAAVNDFEEAVRLEVSGTDEGTPNDIRVRLAQKAAQAQRGDSNLPALATVIGFKASKIAMCDVTPKK